MSLFVCSQCGVVENTALGDFWAAQLEKRPRRCSECAFGKWHGRFPKEQWDGIRPVGWTAQAGWRASKRGATND